MLESVINFATINLEVFDSSAHKMLSTSCVLVLIVLLMRLLV